ncbi:hypothetical protein BJ912DRAFT_979092, partial [Pholiota molesta]
VQAPIAVRPRGYSTSSRRSTPTPAFPSPSAYTPTSSSPTTPSHHGNLKRSESNRHFDHAERRMDANPYRKRRTTEDDQLRATIAEKEKENSTLSQQLYTPERPRGCDQEKWGKVLSQLQAAQKEAAEKERAAAKKIAELEAAQRRKDDELRTAQARLRAAEEKQLTSPSSSKCAPRISTVCRPFDYGRHVFRGGDHRYGETLNAEIFQTAAYMAELIEDDSWGYISRRSTPNSPCISCILSRWSVYKIRAFLIGQFGDNLAKVYQMIRESEAQAIAGRWRALTNAKLSTQFIVDILINMLCLCGWSTSSEKSKKAVLLMQQMVFNIEKMTSQIKTATKEGITTADLDVFVVHSRDSLRDGMEDVYADGSSGDARNSETANNECCARGRESAEYQGKN